MIRSLPLAAAVLALAAAPAHAVTNSFTSGTDWNTPGNWSLGHVPTATEDVTISAAANPSLSADGVANSISVVNPRILTVTGHTLAIGSGASSLSGQLVIGTNGLVTLAGPMAVTHGGGPANPAISFGGGDGGRLDILSGG